MVRSRKPTNSGSHVVLMGMRSLACGSLCSTFSQTGSIGLFRQSKDWIEAFRSRSNISWLDAAGSALENVAAEAHWPLTTCHCARRCRTAGDCVPTRVSWLLATLLNPCIFAKCPYLDCRPAIRALGTVRNMASSPGHKPVCPHPAGPASPRADPTAPICYPSFPFFPLLKFSSIRKSKGI